MIRFLIRSLFILISIFLGSCNSLRHVADKNNLTLSCKFEVIVPTDKGGEKINGVIKILKDEVIRVSFRAPMIRSELALLEYKPNSLLAIDRTNKEYAKETYLEILDKGIKTLSFEELQAKILRASLAKKKVFMLAENFGWEVFPDATIALYQFNNKPFKLDSIVLSKRYKQSSIPIMLKTLGL